MESIDETQKETVKKEKPQTDTLKPVSNQAPMADFAIKSFPAKSQSAHSKGGNLFSKPLLVLFILAVGFLVMNQMQLNTITGMVGTGVSHGVASVGAQDLANLDLDSLHSTGHSVAAVFPVENIHTTDDAMGYMFPIGTPDYGEALGVSYDDPVNSLAVLARMYRGLKSEVQQNDPEAWDRYLNLALKPVGISCEFCCGVGPTGVNKNGDSTCGCQHNPAVLTVALYLTAYTDYNDGEVLREVLRWKTLFFPKNMIELGMSVAGGDTSSLSDLPGMVGGC